jgi:hypothetical protein
MLAMISKFHTGLARFALLATMTAGIAFSSTMAKAVTITFDDLGPAGTGIFVPANYTGYTWSNFVVLDADLEFATYGTNGFKTGNSSGKNVAYNLAGNPATVQSANPFNVASFRATSAWREGLTLTIEAFTGATTVFLHSYTLSSSNSSLITLAVTGITKLRFKTSGGSPSVLNGDGTQLVLDDLKLFRAGDPSPVPLPAGLPLLAAALTGIGLLKSRKSAQSRP